MKLCRSQQPPQWHHLGLLRNADRSKLSKRKNPVSIFHYRELGYMPETLLNFMANLGFSMGADVERFTVEQMIEAFDWSRVSAGGPVFDAAKLEAFNGADIRAMSVDALYERLQERVLAPARIKGLLAQAQERVHRLDDFIPYLSFFFGGGLDYTSVLDKIKAPALEKLKAETLARIAKHPAAYPFILATSSEKHEGIDGMREAIVEAQPLLGPSLKHDLAVAVADLPAFVEQACAALAAALPGVRPYVFGHAGDGNLHFNLSPPPGMAPAAFLDAGPRLRELLHGLVAGFGGSFAAEHGIGRIKTGEMARWKSPVELDLMRRVKAALDPAGILNPGKVLPPPD